MIKVSGIYKIQSIIKPDRVYIGSALNLNKRWNEHKRDLIKNRHHAKKLQNHFNKYGINDLQFTIIVGCPIDELIKEEQFFIDSYNPYFNSSPTAGSNKGCKMPEESVRREAEKKKGIACNEGYRFTEEQKKHLSEVRKGKKWSGDWVEERKRKAGELARIRMAGRIVSDETKKKCSAWQKGKPKSKELMDKFRRKGPYTPEELEKRRAFMRGNTYFKGKKHSEETRKKMSLSRRGENNPRFGKVCSEETKQKIREKALLRFKNKRLCLP